MLMDLPRCSLELSWLIRYSVEFWAKRLCRAWYEFWEPCVFEGRIGDRMRCQMELFSSFVNNYLPDMHRNTKVCQIQVRTIHTGLLEKHGRTHCPMWSLFGAKPIFIWRFAPKLIFLERYLKTLDTTNVSPSTKLFVIQIQGYFPGLCPYYAYQAMLKRPKGCTLHNS